MFEELTRKGKEARLAARRLSSLGTTEKDDALQRIADKVVERRNEIVDANQRDLEAGQAAGLGDAMLDRLMLNTARLEGIAGDVLSVKALADPVGETFESRTFPNGLQIGKRRVPVGVIGVIYESRPNVTIDISVLCLKSGNAAILRGGKEAAYSNRVLANVVADACADAGIPDGAIQLIDTPDRELVKDLLTANRYIDMIIPRGGAGLHRFALENATIPVITGGIGICHIFVDKTADLSKAVPIVHNAKVQRPTVCNALDTLLVHSSVAAKVLPRVADDLHGAGVEIRCDARSMEILRGHQAVKPAGDQDFDTEFLALVMAVRVVDTLDEALDHIYQHGTSHSDAILTEDYGNAMKFVNEVDSAAVYVNASTRFTDGSQFGLGAEVAVSTQRLHARGPMGLKELTTYKWVIFGDGQYRK